MGWGGQFVVIVPDLRAVIVINQSTANAHAEKQSENFVAHIFPMLFDLLNKN